MIGTTFKYNGITIPTSKTEARSAKWRAIVEWTNVSTRNNMVVRDGSHGVFEDPTYAQQRFININSVIFEQNKALRDALVFSIKSMFGLVSLPAIDDEYKEFTFFDNSGNEYFALAKVYTLPQFSLDELGATTSFNVTLVTKDPFIREKTPIETEVDYSLYGGCELDNFLPIQLNKTAPETIINNAGSFSSSTVITLSGIAKNPKFINYTNNSWFGLELEVGASDTLIIDGVNNTIELNGVDVSAYRMIGSSFLVLNIGDNYVGWTDDDYVYGEDRESVTVQHYITHL